MPVTPRDILNWQIRNMVSALGSGRNESEARELLSHAGINDELFTKLLPLTRANRGRPDYQLSEAVDPSTWREVIPPITNFKDDVYTRRDLVENFLVENCVHISAGQTGNFKTFALMELMRATTAANPAERFAFGFLPA